MSDRSVAVLVFAVSVVLASFYRPDQQPLHGDSSYLFFMGYALSRGLRVYADTTLGYTPLGAMAVAVTIWIAKLLSTDILITTRWIAVLVVAATSVLVYFCAKPITGNRRNAVIAAVCLSCFASLAILASTNLDPKLLLAFFLVLSLLGAQQKRWFLSGAGAALAASCWQPGAVLVAAGAVIVLCHSQSRLRNVLVFLAGLVAGFLPAIAYLTLAQEWTTFYFQAYELKIAGQAGRIFPSGTRLLKALYPMFRSELLYALIAACAIVHFAFLWLSRLPRILRRMPSPENPCFPLFLYTAAWIVFSYLHVQGWDDVAPFFPLVAIWGAVGVARILQWIPLENARSIGAVLILCYMAADTLFYSVPFTLAREKHLVVSIAADLPPDGRVLALGAEEVYVILDRPSYWKYLRLDRWFHYHLRETEPGGCDTLMQKLKQSPPDLVVIRSLNPGPCQTRIEQDFLKRYAKSQIPVPAKRPFLYDVYRRTLSPVRRNRMQISPVSWQQTDGTATTGATAALFP